MSMAVKMRYNLIVDEINRIEHRLSETTSYQQL